MSSEALCHFNCWVCRERERKAVQICGYGCFVVWLKNAVEDDRDPIMRDQGEISKAFDKQKHI